MQLSVVILAAGQGKRMNSDLPKVLQPLAGRPLLQHVIDAARELDPTAIYVVYGHGGVQVQATLSGQKVDWVLQVDQLGTGHAVMQALPLIPDDHTVLVLYGDVPLIRAETLHELLAPAAAGSLVVLSVMLDVATGYGRIVRDPHGRPTAIVEQQDATPEQQAIREVNTGVLAAPAALLRRWLLGVTRNNVQREYLLTDIVALAAASSTPVETVLARSAAEVLGVNDKLQLAQVESALRQFRAERLLRAGATLADPTRVDVRGTVTVERDVFIDINVIFEGTVHLGARVHVGPHTTLKDCRVGADTQIKANCVLEDATVGRNCCIGPFSRLRPGAALQDDVHIGNFVEVKNSVIGDGSKVNHLSYVGDAQIGSGVNVGAGTITCNYDGANKWPTVIGDGAFIGSGSMLVAPVRIGSGATIGAGSTITSPAPDGRLTLTRTKQATSNTWQRPAKLDEGAKRAAVDAALHQSDEKPDSPKR